MLYGVIDIGTRATRLLMGDTDDLAAHGFDFQDYRNMGDLTEAGQGIVPAADGSAEMRIAALEKTVRYVLKCMKTCNRAGIAPEDVVAVGTEAFRRVGNRQEIVELLEKVCHVHVTILSPEQEAQTTFWAAMVACREFYQPGEPFAVIEQGGGSTQITVASVDDSGAPTQYGQVSIPELGTVLLRRRFLDAHGQRRVGTAHEAVLAFARDSLAKSLEKEFAGIRPRRAFALGKVITDYGSGPNWQVHGRQVTRRQIEDDPDPAGILPRYTRYTVDSLLKDAVSGAIPESVDDIEKVLERVYGLPCYAAILDYFGLDELRICGAGLRYGVFFRLAHGRWDVSDYED